MTGFTTVTINICQVSWEKILAILAVELCFLRFIRSSQWDSDQDLKYISFKKKKQNKQKQIKNTEKR